MKYKISKDRKKLTLTVDLLEIDLLKRLGEEINSDRAMYDWFEALVCNSELEWINPADTGDLTDAPMLGIWQDDRMSVERWAFMDYQVRSVLADLRDKGEVVFIS